MKPSELLEQSDALLVVDVQNDFLPGGTLAVEGGQQIIPVLNDWIAAAESQGVPVIASRDWHPVEHVSFAERGGPWPVHCVQDTHGAAFHADLRLPRDVVLVSKGTRFDEDAYSAFENTGLDDYLGRHGIRRLWVGGLTQDICVKDTVLAARQQGYDTVLIPDATLPVDSAAGEEALQAMRGAGAKILGEA